MTKEWFTALELATLALPSLPNTERGFRFLALRESWTKRKREGRGGGHEFHINNLPVALRIIVNEMRANRATRTDAANTNRLALVTGSPSTDPTATDPAETRLSALVPSTGAAPRSALALPDWQRRAMNARLALLAEIDRLAPVVGRDRAIRDLVDNAAHGLLREELKRLVPIANARAGKEGKRNLSRATLYRWLDARDQGGATLAPREPAGRDAPAWSAALMRLWRGPSKKTLRQVHEALLAALPPEMPTPSYDQARRFIASLSVVDRNRGRFTGNELQQFRPYVKRTTADLLPLTVVIADGHAADLRVAHPITGAPFRPEITTIVDVKTRKAIGWSAALKENALAVLDALRHAVETCGLPEIFYTDGGPGYCNALMSDDGVGMLATLGITHETGRAGNPQGHGLIERTHQSIWIRGARNLASYAGRDMDRAAYMAAEKRMLAEIKATGASRLLMDWSEFLAWAQRQVDDFNARPHRALPTIVDASGRRRHKSPAEAWDAAIAAGFAPLRLDPALATHLFRPQVERKTNRGLVSLFGNSYFSRALEHSHGDTVIVRYDVHDASRVWVSDSDGRHLCIAEIDANAAPFFPKSFIDITRERRAKTRRALRERQIRAIDAELAPAMIEHAPGAALTPEQIEAADAALAAMEPDQAPDDEPPESSAQFGHDDGAKVAWMKANPGAVTDDDRAWLAERMQSQSFRMLHDLDETTPEKET